ncbi:hypothetical protein FNV43_RR21612 [Rhamnella rubrinervis]|uniref:Uncharacterized protein n=1 Tax=Rhamnella rubrinervis TaxID=2594499 RepID=A0A8K0E0C3_9ROSA|nr:hypothetical protein FNV43_RR21612 [Rhamnella rubrinervis]
MDSRMSAHASILVNLTLEMSILVAAERLKGRGNTNDEKDPEEDLEEDPKEVDGSKRSEDFEDPMNSEEFEDHWDAEDFNLWDDPDSD